MTEDEARKKWCPMVRIYAEGSGAAVATTESLDVGAGGVQRWTLA